jgi:tRNA(Ile)-lysidine synthetase-like protein
MNTILDFWRANKAFWLPTTEKEKAAADKEITERFLNYDYTQDNVYGQVIYLDQFMRHFDREKDLTEPRKAACRLVKANLYTLTKETGEVEIVFSLMPFKHLKDYSFIFYFLHSKWIHGQGKSFAQFPILNAFYKDTYKKAFTIEEIKNGIFNLHPVDSVYDSEVICDFYPVRYRNMTWNEDVYAGHTNELDRYLEKYAKTSVVVSLSGGVDSMIMLAVLKRLGAHVTATHIVYGNRAESLEEYAFLVKYCRRLGIPLFVYRIQWLRRECTEREFYESMTRDIRFMVYKAVLAITRASDVLLGHIRDDVVENIWTNLAKGQHLSNLKKMSAREIQMGVAISRPFLNVEKSTIYNISHQLAIPYLKNTTPSWSNRGKFREHFHAATHKQFGPSVDAKLVEVAEILEKQNRIVEKLLYDPILKSGEVGGVYTITAAVETEMDEIGWSLIFERICHGRGLAKPGIHAIKDFIGRLGRFKQGTMRVPMKRNVTAVLSTDGRTWSMKIE